MKGKTLEERLSSYNEIREEAQKLYATFFKVFCPALGQHVHFTSNGFNHLIYQSAKKERDKKTQNRDITMIENSTGKGLLNDDDNEEILKNTTQGDVL